MKSILKNWNWFEIIFLLVSLITITICYIAGVDKNVLSFITSLVGVVSVMFVAKGLFYAPYVNIGYNILYSIVAITQRYYGEAIIYIAIMIPISLISIISWIKNRNKSNNVVVDVNSIHGKEYLYLTLVTIVSTFGFYFLLKALNTSELIISTISLISSMVASYLMLRRCKYYALGFVVNDIILIIMWSLVVVNSGISYLPTVISFCVFLVNDIYGFIHWLIEERKQLNKSTKERQNVNN